MKLPFGGENILAPVATPNLSDPRPGTEEYDYALSRDESTRLISAMPWLPQSPDSDEWAKELYDRIEEAERKYAAPNLRLEDYEKGTATEPDEIAVIRGEVDNPYVFTAEHATSPINVVTEKYRFADKGTGGLAAVAAEDYGTALIMRGRQTTNVPSVVEHPIKTMLRQELVTAAGFLSVHGKNPGMFVHPDDRAEVHACIGLGLGFSEAQHELASKVVLAARDDLGLYVVISNDQPAYIQKPGSTELKRLEDGTAKLSRLAALKPNMTTNFSRNYLRQVGNNVSSMQIELTDLLRITPLETGTKDKKSRIIGVALGYKLLEKVVKLSLLETAEDAWPRFDIE
jgi:hypothetical protein